MTHIILLTQYVQAEQSAFMRPISVLFGFVMNFFFEIVYFFTVDNSLGLAIILLTLTVRFTMLPLGLKSQKSTQRMAALQPEIEKIKKKYEDKKDKESQQKMAAEIQNLYSKNNVSMLGGCLPLLIQMPIFVALNFIMRQSFLFINKLGDIYHDIAELLYMIPTRFNLLRPLADPLVPNNMVLDISEHYDLSRVINKFSEVQWDAIRSSELFQKTPSVESFEGFSILGDILGDTNLPVSASTALDALLSQKTSIETFFGINLLENAGYLWPGILIPIFSTIFMFLSSWLMQKKQTVSNDPQQKMMQRMMLYAMPLIIGFTTINFPAGVGIYWTVSNVFQVGQQLLLSKFYTPPEVVGVINEPKRKRMPRK